MAKTVKVGDKYYNEGVEVPAPKKPMPKKVAAKKTAPKRDRIADAWEEAKKRRARFGRM